MTSDPTSHAFKLRELVKPADRSKIFDLLNAGGFFYPHEMAYGMGLFDEHLLKGENSSYQFMLHENDEKILAAGCFGVLPLTDRRYHLHWFAVAHGHHGQGIGRKLEAAIVARIRMQGGVKIYAEISNRPYHAHARKFYEMCGYNSKTALPDYYGHGDDKLMYVKDL